MADATDFLPSVGTVVDSLTGVSAGTVSAPQFQTRALKSHITVYYLPSDASSATQGMMMAALTLCGRCEEDRPATWQSFVITWSVLCFPELLDTLRNDPNLVDYEFKEFPMLFRDEVASAMRAQVDPSTQGDVFVSFPPNLPDASTIPFNPELVVASETEGLYSYYAMMVFIMGKSIGSNNLASIASQRPSALIRKRQLQQCEYLLIGDGKIAPGNYRHIQSGWIRSTRPRITIVRHLALLVASPNRSETLDPLCVNLDMLRNAGQTYMYHIHELLVACPWCITIPALRSAFYHYAKMVQALSSQPDWFQPFYKLAYQDSTKTVRRKDIEALIGVAAFYAAQTKKTMSQYRIDQGTFAVIRMFIELAKSRGLEFKEITDQQTTEVSTL